MTTEDQIVAMFAKANPVPSLDLLDPVEPVDLGHLTDPSERSSAMTEVKTEAKEEVGGRKPRLVAVLAVTAIALVALAILLTRDGGVASPESVANAYMEARENLDAEAALTLFASDAEVNEEEFDFSQMPALFAWYRASNWNWTPGECTISSGEVETLARCSYVFENDWTRALGHAPVTGQIQIVVSDGEITRLNSSLDTAQFNDVWMSFVGWIGENHSDDFFQMYNSSLTAPLIDDNSIALWAQHTEEFVASAGG